MSTITIRRSVSGAPIAAPGIAGAFGLSKPSESDDLEVTIDIDTFDSETIDRAALSATTAFNVIESFADPEPGIIEFIDEASQTETDHVVYTEAEAAEHVRLGKEETPVDGKTAEELRLQNGAAYYVTSIDGDKRLMIYDREAFEDREVVWVLTGLKSLRFAAPAVSN